MVGFKQIFLILAVIFLIRFIGKVMIARRNIAAQDAMKRHQKAKEESQKNMGKTTVHKVEKGQYNDADFSDYEEIK